MLKIKDNSSLEELKDYGFEYEDDIKAYTRKIDDCWYNLICIDVEDRKIFKMTEEIGYWTITFSDEEFFNENDIKDLINLRIVEKVEE